MLPAANTNGKETSITLTLDYLEWRKNEVAGEKLEKGRRSPKEADNEKYTRYFWETNKRAKLDLCMIHRIVCPFRAQFFFPIGCVTSDVT